MTTTGRGMSWRARLTRCKRGHEFTPENTGRQRKTGKRFCRACYRARYEDRRDNDTAFRLGRTERMRRWREANRERDRRNWTALRAGKKAWIDEFKQQTACKACGESHIACLDFHHRNPSEKDGLISVSVARWSLSRIQAEVAKCDILCANCHRKLHWEQRNSD